MRRTIGIPVQLIVCESLAFSFEGKSLRICARLLLETVRYRLLGIFFSKLHEWVRWAHTEIGLSRGLIYSTPPVVVCACSLRGHIPIFFNVASARFSQNVISIERYRSTAAESSARAWFSDPRAPQT